MEAFLNKGVKNKSLKTSVVHFLKHTVCILAAIARSQMIMFAD